VKQVLRDVKYPINVTFLLGDLDYAVADGCRFWCEPDWENILNRDTERIVAETTERATRFFGTDCIRVQKWSSLYSANNILAELKKAETLVTPENSLAIIKSSFKIYKQQWGYAALAKKMKIDERALDAFIIGDVQRMAAQYRVEANWIQSVDGLQLWCEAVPNPGWPIELSNFDKAGYLASLIMD
jgi:hypothetical protein